MKKKPRNKSKSRRKLTPQERELNDLKIIQQNIANARKLRAALTEIMQEKPDPEGFEHLAKLDRSIAVEEHRLHSRFAANFRREFPGLAESLHASVDEFDDGELLRSGDEAQPVKNLQNFIAHRDRLADVLHKLPADENPEAIIENFNRVINEVEAKIKQKRANARKRADDAAESERRYNETQAIYKQVFPDHIDLRERIGESDREIPPTPLTADGTEYEMYDDYKEAVRERELTIEFRDKLKEIMKNYPPDDPNAPKHLEFLQTLADLDTWIIDSEKALAAEKTTFQEAMRSRAKAEAVVTDYENALQDAIAQNPYLLLGAKAKPRGQ